MSATPISYYVYYRVAPAQVVAARRAVTGILKSLEQRTAVSGRLLRRQDDPMLWMEVYESVRDTTTFEAALTKLVDASGLVALLAPGTTRTTERFVAAQT